MPITPVPVYTPRTNTDPNSSNSSNSSNLPNSSNTTTNTASAGQKRARPFDEEGPPSILRRHEEALDELTARWERMLGGMRTPVRERTSLFLENIAHHALTASDKTLAQDLFNELIASEQYELFAEVFKAYNQTCVAMAQEEEKKDSGLTAYLSKPFTPTLVLQLPQDWVPTRQNEMLETFRSLQVQRVEVLRPKGQVALGDYENALLGGQYKVLVEDGEEEIFAEKTYDRAHGHGRATSQEIAEPIPAAACACVAALLQNGAATEFAVEGALADLDLVANAMAGSPLRSVAFRASCPVEWSTPNHPLSEQEALGYRTLALCLETCKTLEHLTIGHPQLLELHDCIELYAQPGGPPLKSLEMRLPNTVIKAAAVGGQPTEAQQFMQAVRQLPALTTFNAEVNVDDAAALRESFLAPLSGHPTLEEFAVKGDGPMKLTDENMRTLPTVLQFASTCPKLASFEWDKDRLGSDAGDELETYRQQGGDLSQLVPYTEMLRILADPNLPLHSLKLRGVPIPPQMLQAFFGALFTNTSLRNIDLEGCYTDLEATRTLVAAFLQNRNLHSASVTSAFDDYYIVLEDGSIHGIAYADPEHGAFELNLRATLDPATAERVKQKFAALKDHASGLSATLASISVQRLKDNLLQMLV